MSMTGKNLQDMTQDQLYEILLDDVRNQRDDRMDEIDRQIDRVETMLKITGLCENCNIRSRANQWAKYCHITCTGPGIRQHSSEKPRLEAPPTGRELEAMVHRLNTGQPLMEGENRDARATE